jgi:hypothetical protein
MDVTIRSVIKEDYINLDKFCVLALREEHKNIVSNDDIEIYLKEYKKEKWLDYWFEKVIGNFFQVEDFRIPPTNDTKVEYFLIKYELETVDKELDSLIKKIVEK